jgi:Carboxypeptidase regulatory-like domain/Tetratricopeptide repeat
MLECAQQKEKSVRRFARSVALPASIVFMFIAVTVSAQRNGPVGMRHGITGRITNDVTNKPMENVEIRLKTSSGQIVSTTFSSPSGNYDFADLAGGNYVITIELEGYEKVERDERLTMTPALTENIAMHKAPGARPEFGDSGAATKGDAVELALPPKAQDALAKGRERLYQKLDPAGSLPFFRKVLEISPGFYDGYYLEGIAYTQQAQLTEAESAFRKAIEGSEHHFAEPCFALASLLTDKKQFAESEQLAHEGMQADPDAWRGYYELARALLGESKFVEAETNGLEARKRKTDFPGLYLILANIHMQLRKNEAVLEDVNAYLNLEPDGPASGQARAIKTQMERALGRTPPGS